MKFLRRHQFIFLFLGTLAFCDVMVIRQFLANEAQHVELREALIRLQEKGYTSEAARCYQELVLDLQRVPTKVLADDVLRTSTLVSTSIPQPENLTWKYYWTTRNELARRSEKRAGQSPAMVGRNI